MKLAPVYTTIYNQHWWRNQCCCRQCIVPHVISIRSHVRDEEKYFFLNTERLCSNICRVVAAVVTIACERALLKPAELTWLVSWAQCKVTCHVLSLPWKQPWKPFKTSNSSLGIFNRSTGQSTVHGRKRRQISGIFQEPRAGAPARILGASRGSAPPSPGAT